DGFTVNYQYETDAGRLSTLTEAAGNLIVRYHYDAAGRIDRKDLGDGSYTTYQYDAANELEHLVNYGRDGSIHSRFDYSYDRLGQRASMSMLDGTWMYEYDA